MHRETLCCYKQTDNIRGKIVQNCDILDMLGAIGIARGFMLAGERALDLKKAEYEYKEKRLKVINELNLDEAKKLEKNKSRFTRLFFENIEQEM